MKAVDVKNRLAMSTICGILVETSIQGPILRTKSHMFVQYSPHVDWLEVGIHDGKWSEGSTPIYNYRLELDNVCKFKQDTTELLATLDETDILCDYSEGYKLINTKLKELVCDEQN